MMDFSFGGSAITAVVIVVLIILVVLLWTYIRAKVTNLAAPPSGPVTVILANPGAISKDSLPNTQTAPPVM